MIRKEDLLKNKDNLSVLADQVSDGDISLLVEWLAEKDDNLRYAVFLLLQTLSARDPRVYRYWDVLAEKIHDSNSYQRSLGLMLIAENVRWDQDNKFQNLCSTYLAHCDDEKFITARQAIQGLNKITSHTRQYRKEIINALTAIDLEKRKDSQKGLLLSDILEVLGKLYQEEKDEKILEFFTAEHQQGNDKIKKIINRLLA